MTNYFLYNYWHKDIHLGPINEFIHPDTILKEIHKTTQQNISDQHKVYRVKQIQFNNVSSKSLRGGKSQRRQSNSN